MQNINHADLHNLNFTNFNSHPYRELAGRLETLLLQRPVTLLSLAPVLKSEKLLSKFQERPIYVCDAYVDGAEGGKLEPYGLDLGDIKNIDHHARLSAMYDKISSGNLAAAYVKSHGPLVANERVIIHHTDCDSVISALILRGILPPDPYFTDAVICADHTAEPHPVADLLQALSSERDLEFSVRELARLLKGEEPSKRAKELIQIAEEEKAEAYAVVKSGEFQLTNGIAWAEFDHTVEGSYFPALLPEAKVIVLAFPHRTKPNHWIMRTRLGNAAVSGTSLLNFRITEELDNNWGGRWNAGSNSRGCGTTLRIHDYVEFISKKLRQ